MISSIECPLPNLATALHSMGNGCGNYNCLINRQGPKRVMGTPFPQVHKQLGVLRDDIVVSQEEVVRNTDYHADRTDSAQPLVHNLSWVRMTSPAVGNK